MVKGYLPPEGPQNVHGVPYNWADEQGAHRIANKVVYGPEEVIITADEQAQKVCEQSGLTQVPEKVAEAVLRAREGDLDADAEQIIQEWQEQGAEPAEEEPDEEPPKDPEEMEEGSDGPAIPTDLESVPYRSEDTVSLQNLATAYGIPANQSAEDLVAALEGVKE